MADENIKMHADIDLTEESRKKFEDELSDAMSSGIGSKKNQDAFNKLFSGKGAKSLLIKNLSDAFKVGEKQQARQAKLSAKLRKDQEKITKLIGTQGKGFKGNAKLMGLIGKQAGTQIAGIAAKINPIVAAVTIAAEMTKMMADQFKRVAEESSKFVGQGSIFTDRGTMDMMQKTGQTATQAQGTQRSLDALGISFEDIQSGKITAEQAALFEELRLRELEKLEKINEIAGPMMKSMQQITLGATLLMQDINDWITMAMAQSSGIQNMIGSIKTFMGRVGPFIQSLIDMVMPAFSIVADVIAFLLDVVSALMPTVKRIMNAITPILLSISDVFTTIVQALSPILEIIGLLLEMIVVMIQMSPGFQILMKAIELVGKALMWINTKVLTPIYNFVLEIVLGIAGFINSIIGMLKDINLAGWKPFKDMEYIDVEGISTSQISSNSEYDNQTTNNYIYGSQDMDQASEQGGSNDLFANSYVLVND